MFNDIKVGIIGGSGLEDPAFIDDYSVETIETPYGLPVLILYPARSLADPLLFCQGTVRDIPSIPQT